MPRRDPSTGQFVSGSGGHAWTNQKRIMGIQSQTIPAADLSGGTTELDIKGDHAELVDFSDSLENDEIFHTDAAYVASYLGMPTTATAEGAAVLNYEIGSDSAGILTESTPTFFGGNQNGSSGIADSSYASTEGREQWFVDQLYAEASLNDTVNGTGAGAAPAQNQEMISFAADLGAGPAYDRDDEIYAPAELQIDNVSDHAVIYSVWTMLYGHVEELD